MHEEYKCIPKAIPVWCPAATGEVADAALEYLLPERLGLANADLPRSAWPPPRRHLWPFGASSNARHAGVVGRIDNAAVPGQSGGTLMGSTRDRNTVQQTSAC